MTQTSDEISSTPVTVHSVPSMTWRTLAYTGPSEELPKDLDAMWDVLVGWTVRASTRTFRFMRQAARVVAMEPEIAKLTDAKLRAAALDLRALYRTGKEKRDTVYRALAIIREVAFRQTGEKPFKVQIAGALAMIHGCVVEMATGEGKTLTATLPATVFGWRGKGCHIITTNDYLAKRDAIRMGPIYQFCGLSVSYVEGETKPDARRDAYLCDVTYLTNKEVCADFSRDRLILGRLRDLPSAMLSRIINHSGTDKLVMRGMHYAIIDEADSIMVDEAVTPLIISGDAPNQEQVDAFKQAATLATQLLPQRHYTVNHRFRDIELTDDGFDIVDDLAVPLGGIWAGERRREELVLQALQAREFFLLGKQYIVSDEGKVVIVDEFTGRLMPDRTWREGLHQAVEAKETLKVNPPKDTFSRISFQRFFRFYGHLCGMTGTGAEAAHELWQIYHTPVAIIPTNMPCVRKHFPDRIFSTESAKWAAVAAEAKRLHDIGRPVLIGTRSVRASERLSELLTKEGLPHAILNAVRHAEEAQIVAEAGQPGKITVATNMAGRGTDIKLGRGVAELGGLHVIATERHEARRVDRQLFGRAARQGDPGSAQAFISLDDELLTRYAPKLVRVLRKRYGHSHTELHSAFVQKVFNQAQRRAQRMALSQRKMVLKSDDWLDESLGFAGADR